jgi:hypothetical protein
MAALGLVAKMDLLKLGESGEACFWWNGRDEVHPERYKKALQREGPAATGAISYNNNFTRK